MTQIRQKKQKVKNNNDLLLKIINDVVSLSIMYHTHIYSVTAL